MKKFITFLGNVLSKSDKASIRRFISFVLLIPYVIGIFVGLYIAVTTGVFNFFLVSILAAGIPIMITYFSLTWQHVIESKKIFYDTTNKINENISDSITPS